MVTWVYNQNVNNKVSGNTGVADVYQQSRAHESNMAVTESEKLVPLRRLQLRNEEFKGCHRYQQQRLIEALTNMRIIESYLDE